MNNIYKALNVNNEKELEKLVESLNLTTEEYVTLYTALNEEMSVDGIRYMVESVTKDFNNGSYEKIQEQVNKEQVNKGHELKEMSMTPEDYDKLKVGDRVKFDPENVRIPDADKYDEVIEKNDKEIKTQLRHHNNQARSKFKFDKDQFIKNYSLEENDFQDKGGATEILWGNKQMDHDYALCDVDGVIQWCFINEIHKNGSIQIEPLDTKVYGDKLPTFSIKKKDIIKFADKDEEKKLDNGELEPFVSFGKTKEKDEGVGYSEYNKGIKGKQTSVKESLDKKWFESDSDYKARLDSLKLTEDYDENEEDEEEGEEEIGNSNGYEDILSYTDASMIFKSKSRINNICKDIIIELIEDLKDAGNMLTIDPNAKIGRLGNNGYDVDLTYYIHDHINKFNDEWDLVFDSPEKNAASNHNPVEIDYGDNIVYVHSVTPEFIARTKKFKVGNLLAFSLVYYKNEFANAIKRVIETSFKIVEAEESDKNMINEKPIKEPKKEVSTADPELATDIERMTSVVNSTTNPEILKGLLSSIEAKLPLATDVEQINTLGELKQKIETKIGAVTKVAKAMNESVEETFDVGDNVSFTWNGKQLSGRVIEVSQTNVDYYNIVSYDVEKARTVTYVKVDPINNNMKRIEGEI